ncbi:MAG: hypothetical protein JRN37_07570 [Nitrososphaerota archaeon]|jgi:hypothetical protein|nr:hypothetical protein [Nitrososphaerota archaeon]
MRKAIGIVPVISFLMVIIGAILFIWGLSWTMNGIFIPNLKFVVPGIMLLIIGIVGIAISAKLGL